MLLVTAGRADGAAGAKRSVPDDEFTRRLSSDGGADVGAGEEELIVVGAMSLRQRGREEREEGGCVSVRSRRERERRDRRERSKNVLNVTVCFVFPNFFHFFFFSFFLSFSLLPVDLWACPRLHVSPQKKKCSRSPSCLLFR
jgi:hypothetical protein